MSHPRRSKYDYQDSDEVEEGELNSSGDDKHKTSPRKSSRRRSSSSTSDSKIVNKPVMSGLQMIASSSRESQRKEDTEPRKRTREPSMSSSHTKKEVDSHVEAESSSEARASKKKKMKRHFKKGTSSETQSEPDIRKKSRRHSRRRDSSTESSSSSDSEYKSRSRRKKKKSKRSKRRYSSSDSSSESDSEDDKKRSSSRKKKSRVSKRHEVSSDSEDDRKRSRKKRDRSKREDVSSDSEDDRKSKRRSKKYESSSDSEEDNRKRSRRKKKYYSSDSSSDDEDYRRKKRRRRRDSSSNRIKKRKTRRSRSLSPPKRKMSPKRLRRCHYVPKMDFVVQNARRIIPKITLLTNYFMMTVPDTDVFVYSTKITPMKRDKYGGLVPIFGETPNGEDRRLKKLLKAANRGVFTEFCRKYSEPCTDDDPTFARIFFNSFSGKKIVAAFDGDRSFYTPVALEGYGPSEFEISGSNRNEFKGSVEVPDEDNPQKKVIYSIVVRFLKTVNIGYFNDYSSGFSVVEPPDEAKKALDIIINYGLLLRSIPLSNGFFSATEDGRKTLGVAKQMSLGHFQSARALRCGAVLNMDQVATSFQKPGPILNLMAQIKMNKVESYSEGELNDVIQHAIRTHVFDNEFMAKIEKYFSKVKVSTTHLEQKRKFKFGSLTQGSAQTINFDYVRDDTHRVMTVAQYFAEIVGKPLKFPELPCIKTGNEKRPVYLPLEFVNMEPNQSTGKLSQQEQLVMGKVFSKQKPHDRFDHITECAENVARMSEEYRRAFNITLNTKPVECEGLVLPRPAITFGSEITGGSEEKVIPDQGKWDLDNRKVFRSEKIRNWIVLNYVLTASSHRIDEFVKALSKKAKEMGVDMEEEPMTRRPSRDSPKYFIDVSLPPHKLGTAGIAAQRRIYSQYQPELMIFIVEQRNSVMYGDIKYQFEIASGVPNQCVKWKNVEDFRAPHCKYLLQNLLLKINLKMGGLNFIVSENLTTKERDRIVSVDILKNKRTMLVGADVTHHVSGSGFMDEDKFMASIAAVTASMDKRHSLYRESLGIQEKEIINDMKSMMSKLIRQYFERNKYLPEAVIMYRDGVADNTFDQIMDIEVKGMKEAFQEASIRFDDTVPKLTVIVVQKRHHTRFIPKYHEEKAGSDLPWERTGNIPSGTLVESQVVHPTDMDFFLCSHDSPVVSISLLMSLLYSDEFSFSGNCLID